MKLDLLCRMDLRYTGDFHLVRPYGIEAGTGWGIGEGLVTGERFGRHGAVVEPAGSQG